jgi:hypothetical protein
MAKGEKVNCDVCRDLYHGKCAREEDIIIRGEFLECDIPFLLQENNIALELWQVLSKFDRAAGFSGIESINSQNARNLCFDYDETWETYEKILIIEGEFIDQWRKEKTKKDKDKNTQSKSNVKRNRKRR